MPAYPKVFWLLLILLPVIILMILQYVNGKRSIMNVAGRWRPKDFYDLYTVKWFFSSLGMIIFIAAVVLSLAGYPGRGVPESYEPKGTDIVFAVDISRSMNAEDVSPSRLDAAERIVRSVCENTPGGRFGLVVFKGRGVKVIPSTEDVEAVYSFLDFLGTDLLTSPGSNIEEGLRTALGTFTGGEERRKYIILLSDGEALSGELGSVLSSAADMDVEIHVVGTATAEGASIPSENGPVTDSSGRVVESRLNEQSLRYIAVSTGGKYHSVSDGALLPQLIALAVGDEAAAAGTGYRIVASDRYRLFLALALLGLLITRLVKVLRWKNSY